ncbi:glycoside hydrolase family 15 protein [Luteibacter sp. CQ10]
MSYARDYLADALVLQSWVRTEDGELGIVDYLAWNTATPTLVREIVGVEGQVEVAGALSIPLSHDRSGPARTTEGWRIDQAGGSLYLLGANDWVWDATGFHLTFHVAAGQRRRFFLTCGDPVVAAQPDGMTSEGTLAAWKAWATPVIAASLFENEVQRSLMVLRALMDRETGGIAAAATTSLPEHPGGTRNWDYRYCWLRDASFTLRAFALAGCRDEAARWRDWLLRTVNPERLQVLYRTSGDQAAGERECEDLEGYRDSRPVRMGNDALTQHQGDVAGEVLASLYEARCHGLPPDPAAWHWECSLVDAIEASWQAPGHGLWEVRGQPKHYTSSKALAWVGVDRAIRTALEFGQSAPLTRWRGLADRIRADILTHGYSSGEGRFVSAYGERSLDASLLLLPLYGFLPPDDHRIVATVDAIESQLMAEGLLYRYTAATFDDGVGEVEGTFTACGFWLVQVLALQRRRHDAQRLGHRLRRLCNDLGLLSEEYDVREKRACGNYPQALSHVGLINAAYALDALN